MSETHGEILANYRGAIDRLSAGYNKGVVLAAVTNHSLDILSDAIEGMESSLSSIVAAFEEIRATSQSTSTNAERIDGMMEEILAKNSRTDGEVSERVNEIEDAAASARQVATLFGELREKTKRIEDITTSIRDVSERTNILAINASIEAARAGSVGKGFRIIANEVRSLSAQTGAFAEQIEETTAEFHKSVGEIDSQMASFLELLERFRLAFGEVLGNFKENAASLGEAGRFLSEISGSIREENLALTEGLGSLGGISESMKDTKAVFGALAKSHSFLDELLGVKA
jgi:methyl-accepting chemotaxis protein